MAKPPKDHTSFGSSTYFVTASTWGHRSLFQTERMARLFLDTLSHYRNDGKYSLHEFVLMPDHFHLLLTPSHSLTPWNAWFSSLKVASRIVRGKNWNRKWRYGKEVMWTTEFVT